MSRLLEHSRLRLLPLRKARAGTAALAVCAHGCGHPDRCLQKEITRRSELLALIPAGAKAHLQREHGSCAVGNQTGIFISACGQLLAQSLCITVIPGSMKPEGWGRGSSQDWCCVAGSSLQQNCPGPASLCQTTAAAGRNKSLHTPGEPLSLQAACTLPAGPSEGPGGHRNGGTDFRGPPGS